MTNDEIDAMFDAITEHIHPTNDTPDEHRECARRIQSLADQVQELTQDRDQLRQALQDMDEEMDRLTKQLDHGKRRWKNT